MNALTSLYNSGADAYKNLFLVDFLFNSNAAIDASNDLDFVQALSIRCGKFDPPEIRQDSYDVRFMNQKIERPRAKIIVDRHFDIEFRLDENYEVYKKLLEQQKVTFDSENSVTKADIQTLSSEGRLFDVRIRVIKGDLKDSENNSDNAEFIELFKFSKCWIDNLKQSAFNSKSSDAMTVTASIRFIDIAEFE